MSLRFTEEEYQKYQSRRGVTPPERAAISDEMRELIERGNAKAPPPLESQEQAAFVRWLQIQDIRHHATPSGEYRHKATAGRLKTQGVCAGVPDLTAWPDEPNKPVLWIEMKRQKKGQLSEAQRNWIEFINTFPMHRAAVCAGCDEAIKFVKEQWNL